MPRDIALKYTITDEQEVGLAYGLTQPPALDGQTEVEVLTLKIGDILDSWTAAKRGTVSKKAVTAVESAKDQASIDQLETHVDQMLDAEG